MTNANQVRAWLNKICERELLTLSEVARRAGVAESTLTRFANGETASLRALTVEKVGQMFGSFDNRSMRGVAESAALYRSTMSADIRVTVKMSRETQMEVDQLDLDVVEIARAAVERAVKTERMKRFSEENREAIESWNNLVEREGLWSDGLRAF